MDRLTAAAVDGLVLGVKLAVAGLVIAAVLGLVAGDYGVIRSQAANGQRAYEALLAIRQQQAAPSPAIPPERSR